MTPGPSRRKQPWSPQPCTPHPRPSAAQAARGAPGPAPWTQLLLTPAIPVPAVGGHGGRGLVAEKRCHCSGCSRPQVAGSGRRFLPSVPAPGAVSSDSEEVPRRCGQEWGGDGRGEQKNPAQRQHHKPGFTPLSASHPACLSPAPV